MSSASRNQHDLGNKPEKEDIIDFTSGFEVDPFALLQSAYRNTLRACDQLTLHPSPSFTYPWTAGAGRAPQMTLRSVSSIFLCSPVPSGTWRTPDLSVPWCCLPASFSVRLVFFPLSLCLAKRLWLDLMNGRQVHTTSAHTGSRNGSSVIWKKKKKERDRRGLTAGSSLSWMPHPR